MGGSSKSVTTGYRYYMGLHIAVCHGPVDALTKITVGDRVAWSGNQTSSGSINVNAPYLFGGDEREGGVVGKLDVMMGEATQAKNNYLQAKLGNDIPAFRGIMSVVWNRSSTIMGKLFHDLVVNMSGQVSANNPYIKPWAFKVRRIEEGWGTSVWNQAKATINTDDMNPAHILYECITNPVWGMGYPASQIDTTTFAAAADKLYDESFGLSMIWNQQSAIGDFIGLVLDHIGGVLYIDQTTGKFALKLIRGDYDAGTLDTFDESTVLGIDSFQRVGYGDTVNEVTVVYRNNSTNRDEAVTVQDLANIQAQGAVVSQTKQYPGIPRQALARRVAMRDLIAASTPLAKVRLRVNRNAWDKIPGDVFKLNWTKLGLSGVIFRVLAINYGNLTDGTITVEAAEDVFGLDDSAYIEQEPSAFTEPTNDPTEISDKAVIEAPYYLLARALTEADFNAIDATDGAVVMAVAAQPNGTQLRYRLWSKVGADDYADQEMGEFAPSARLNGAIGPTDTVLSYDSENNVALVVPGTLALIKSDTTEEWVEVTYGDLDASTVTVARGCIDTVPQAHPDNALILFCGEAYINYDPTERATSEAVGVKLTTIATGGELEPDDVTATTVTADQRLARPYPPGKFRFNSSAYPDYIAGALTVSWAHRDRTQQTASLVDESEASIGPEATTTYTLRLYDQDGVLRREMTGLTGTSYTWSAEEDDTGGGSGVVALLHFNGTNGSTTFTDETGRAWTRSGNAQISTAQSKFGGASGLFDGSGDYLTTPDAADLEVTTQDWTIEAWVRFSAIAANGAVIATKRAPAGNDGGWQFGVHSTKVLQIAAWDGSGTVINVLGATVLTTGTWYHLAATKEGTTWRVFVDGVLDGSGTESATATANTHQVIVGRNAQFTTYDLNGYLDDLRITSGTARYTASFSPPAAELPYGGADLNGQIRAELWSVRDGLDSWQVCDHTCDRAGYSLNYGLYYGAGV